MVNRCSSNMVIYMVTNGVSKTESLNRFHPNLARRGPFKFTSNQDFQSSFSVSDAAWDSGVTESPDSYTDYKKEVLLLCPATRGRC